MASEGRMPQTMEEIETRGVSDVILERILDLISAGALSPGDPLPPQRQLASQLGVSLSSLREALHGLAAIGVIEVKHGLGTFVCSHPADSLTRRVDWSRLFDKEERRELMEARRVFDVALAGYAAQRATEEQVARMTALFKGMVDSWRAGDVERLDEHDVRFHLALAEAAGNSVLFQLAQSLYEVVDRFIRLATHTATGMENHRRVLEAITRRHPEEAERAMRVLLDQTEEQYQQRNGPQ